MTIAEFVQAHGITASVKHINSNPNMAKSEYMNRHFEVTLQLGNDSMMVPFSQGDAHTEEPTAEDVLNCLASDSAGPDSFEEFCSEYGYDEDSRTAERIFNACQRQKAELESFLGTELFSELLYQTEAA